MNGVDIFIYNAGYGEPSATLNPEIERNVYEINVKGFVDLTAYMFNFFVQQGHGHIAATSSVASVRGLSAAPAYSASKAFMSNYMEGLYMKARRLKTNIYITDIQPGFVNTKPVSNKRFWVAPPQKAAGTNYRGHRSKKMACIHHKTMAAYCMAYEICTFVDLSQDSLNNFVKN